MNNQIHSLSNQLYNIKHKITDLEYYNLMETLTLLANGGNAVERALEVPPLTTSSASSPPPSPYIEESSNGSVSSCCSQETYNCCC